MEKEIVRLKSTIRSLNNPNVGRQEIEQILIGAQEFRALDDRYQKLRAQFSTFGGLLRSQFDRLRNLPGVKLDFESNLNQLLATEGLEVSVVNGIANIIDYKEKVVEVPIQDARTKHLIHLLAVQMRKYFEKYPKLR